MSQNKKKGKRKMRNSRSRNGRSRRRPREGGMVVTAVNLKPGHTRVFRYSISTTNEVQITRGDLLNLLLSVTNGSTAATSLLDSVKLLGIRIAIMPHSDCDVYSTTLTWTGDRSPDQSYSMVVTNAIPYSGMYKPPDESLAGYWSNHTSDQTEVLFSLDGTTSTAEMIVDLHVVVIYGDGTTDTQTLGSAASFTGIAAANLPLGSNSMQPVGLNLVSTT
jgi:hypothetical protein